VDSDEVRFHRNGLIESEYPAERANVLAHLLNRPAPGYSLNLRKRI
jgi:hypothetical protein